MVVIRLSLDLYGKSFIPTLFLNSIHDDFCVELVDDVLHTLSLEKKGELGVNNKLLSYEEWYVNFINKHYSKMVLFGVDRIDLFMNVYFWGQCNFEIFDNSLLQTLASKNVSLPISIFKIPLDEIRLLLIDCGYNNSEITEMMREDI